MISIIIPVYNGEKYLADCIESCLNQTYSYKEIIIVNDGSTDNTENIIEFYHKKYFNKIGVIHKKNGGTASALNAGIRMMKGNWFKWLSADDLLYSKALEEMMNFINDYLCNDSFLFYTDYDIVNENNKKLSIFKEPDRNNLSQEIQAAEMYHNFFGNGSTSLIHKTMFYKVGLFREGMPYLDDYEFWLRWMLKFNLSFCHIPIISIRYRMHPDSLTSKKDFIENNNLLKKLRTEYGIYLSENQKKYLKTLKRPLKKRLAQRFPKLVRLIKH